MLWLKPGTLQSEGASDVKPTQLTVRLDPIKSRAGET